MNKVGSPKELVHSPVLLRIRSNYIPQSRASQQSDSPVFLQLHISGVYLKMSILLLRQIKRRLETRLCPYTISRLPWKILCLHC